MSDIESGTPPVGEAGVLLGKLLSNPDLLRNISSVFGTSGTQPSQEPPPTMQNQTTPTGEGSVADGISRVLSNPEMMAKLPNVMKMLAPMMQEHQSTPLAQAAPAAVSSPPSGEQNRHSCRNDLLLALKPFLSPERCRAIDMLLGLSRLGDVLQKMI